MDRDHWLIKKIRNPTGPTERLKALTVHYLFGEPIKGRMESKKIRQMRQ